MTTQNSINQGTLIATNRGGTGVNSPTAHGILVGEGASPMVSKVLTNGQVLVGVTGSDPVPTAVSTLLTGSMIVNATGANTNVSGGTPTSLFGYTIPANTFVNPGDFIIIEGCYSFAASGVSSTYTLTYEFGATDIYQVIPGPVSIGGPYFANFRVIVAVKSPSQLSITGCGIVDISTGASTTISSQDITGFSFSSTITLNIYGSVSSGTGTLTSLSQAVYGNV